MASGGLTSATPFGYAGATPTPPGSIYLINRYYDPSTGQFISVDPDLSQTLQPYAYTDGDPVIDTDPTGLEDVLGNHDTCKNVADGRWKAKLCVEVNTSSLDILGFHTNDSSEPQAVWVVTSGGIARAGAGDLNMEVCGNTGPTPGHPRSCHQNDDQRLNPRSTCWDSRECYVDGNWYTNSEVNWEDAWVVGAWIQWQGGPLLTVTGELHESPLCRIGNGGKYVCDPNW